MTKPKKQIWFKTDRNGKRRARYWQPGTFSTRSFPVGVDEAEVLIATEQAVRVDGDPFSEFKVPT